MSLFHGVVRPFLFGGFLGLVIGFVVAQYRLDDRVASWFADRIIGREED